jgi:hypothetical protein
MRNTHYHTRGAGIHRNFFNQPHLLGQILNSKNSNGYDAFHDTSDHSPPMPIDPRFNLSLVRPLLTPSKKKALSFKF